MFQFSYISFLAVSIKHDFYTDKICRDFDYVPLPGTSVLMESFGLRFKNIDGRLSIFQQQDENNLPFQELDAKLDLFFKVNVKTDILNITEQYGSGKYFFSNLKTDGTYNTNLTQNATLSPADGLAEICSQQKVLNFLPRILNTITLRRLSPGTGWSVLGQFPVDSKMNSLEIRVNNPGLYQVEKNLVAGGKEVMTFFMSDELMKSGNTWSLIHLQVKPGDKNLAFNVILTPKKSVWQYFLVEMDGRTGGAIIPASLEVTYKADLPSRYPGNMIIPLKNAGTYSDPEKKYVNAIFSAGRIKAVYLFETADKLQLMEGLQPQVKIRYSNKEIAGKVTIPNRSMTSTTIIYKL